jgi:hypothetical protein
MYQGMYAQGKPKPHQYIFASKLGYGTPRCVSSETLSVFSQLTVLSNSDVVYEWDIASIYSSSGASANFHVGTSRLLQCISHSFL